MQEKRQEAEDALCLVALRETASHLLNYGIWVALSHLRTYIDIPAAASRFSRIHQALQLACDLTIEQLGTQNAASDAVAQYSPLNHTTNMKHTAERLKQAQRSRKARVDNSQCMMWSTVCASIKSVLSEGSQNSPHTSLLILDSSALEFAFEVLSAAGLHVRLLQTESNMTEVGSMLLYVLHMHCAHVQSKDRCSFE